jgi:hypothetical protein
MRIGAYQTLLKTALPARLKLLVKGIPGIGKSETTAQTVKELGYDILLEHPALSDPTDQKGLPANVNGRAEFLPYGSMLQMMEAKNPLVVVLEDVGHATPAVQASWLHAIQAREVCGHKISDEVRFIALTNDTKHAAGVSGLIEPFKSRWDSIIEVEFDKDDFSKWLIDADFPPVCVAFSRMFPGEICKFEPTKEITNSACPRTTVSMFNWYRNGVTDLEVLSGAAGKSLATNFRGFLDLAEKAPSLDGIMLAPKTAPIPEEMGIRYIVASGLARRATPENFERIMTYATRFATEAKAKMLEVLIVKEAWQIHGPKIAGTKAFQAYAVKNDKVFN